MKFDLFPELLVHVVPIVVHFVGCAPSYSLLLTVREILGLLKAQLDELCFEISLCLTASTCSVLF